uniref:Uncharacterized protein n=1 Tax=Chromera velia CCMP2878 TaxID=1169474 RepID=A0A0G4IDZ6_9ALVE|eukprot:Cvel_13447.t1-p1 / transcript=Cvel_13447.t1 / gene=Cvel_13447 / organism=Chromera_velia_CCMP2878 / gene_product=hypothetical protein / transcript_product=hypothetical protein / location=Cvel_scaffold919:11257-11807(+) / protein_length=148 / sequence_SO=supercontig / SO=protein_coding / is_pseudo=false
MALLCPILPQSLRRERCVPAVGARAAPYPPDTAVMSRQVPDSALAAAPRRSRRPGATRGALEMLSGADYHEADDRSIQPGSSRASSAPPSSHGSGGAAAIVELVVVAVVELRPVVQLVVAVLGGLWVLLGSPVTAAGTGFRLGRIWRK